MRNFYLTRSSCASPLNNLVDCSPTAVAYVMSYFQLAVTFARRRRVLDHGAMQSISNKKSQSPSIASVAKPSQPLISLPSNTVVLMAYGLLLHCAIRRLRINRPKEAR
jgi:hypothetical protein